MFLKELLKELPDDKNICLGAKNSFLYIAPKAELSEWLTETEKAFDLWNMELTAAQKCGLRLQEKIKKSYCDREVISCQYNENPHQGYIVIIKGNEQGRYHTRREITKEPFKPLRNVDPDAAQNLISAILAESINDIAEEEAFRQYYGETNLTRSGEMQLKALKQNADNAKVFLNDKENLLKWTNIDGSWIQSLSKKKARIIMEKKDKQVAKDSMPARFKTLYNLEERNHIKDMVIAGIPASEILAEIGRGENDQATEEDIKEFEKRYETNRKNERRKFMLSNFKDARIPIIEQMNIDEDKGRLWIREYNKRKKLNKQLGKEI